MRRIKVTLPATITHLGTGLHSLGLAVALHTTLEISERGDTALNVETTGEDAGRYGLGLRHPVVLGMSRIFQRLERTVPGLNVHVENRIPAALGIGQETTFFVAGIIAANNLFGGSLSRADLLKIAAQVTGRADQAVTTMVGGLTITTQDGERVLYRSLPVTAMKVVIVLPTLPNYLEQIRYAIPDRLPVRDMLHNLSRLPFLIEALRTGDFALAGQAMEDHLFAPYRAVNIPGFEDAVQVAKLNGAASVTLCGNGPAVLALAANNHQRIAEVITGVFEDIGISAKAWVLPIDTQGVVLSVAQTS
ncbi:MAG: hypothetical protein U0670_20615 [Anaerolineae bacterium]